VAAKPINATTLNLPQARAVSVPPVIRHQIQQQLLRRGTVATTNIYNQGAHPPPQTASLTSGKLIHLQQASQAQHGGSYYPRAKLTKRSSAAGGANSIQGAVVATALARNQRVAVQRGHIRPTGIVPGHAASTQVHAQK